MPELSRTDPPRVADAPGTASPATAAHEPAAPDAAVEGVTGLEVLGALGRGSMGAQTGGPLTRAEHERYAKDILSSLTVNHSEADDFHITPDPKQSRNAAKAMTAILCHRIFTGSGHQSKLTANTTHEWRGGVFNCRNITDRGQLWTNMRRRVADEIHVLAHTKPAAYILAFSSPSSTALNVWVIPEPLLYESLPHLPLKAGGDEYTIQISTSTQRIEHCSVSPDLAPYFQVFSLSPQELEALRESRQVDAAAKKLRRTQERRAGDTDSDCEGHLLGDSETNRLLADTNQQWAEAGVFDPSEIADGRERVLSSIVRRRGQQAFRAALLSAYQGQCAISGCNAEPVLEAAHIISYKGRETNFLGNGLLLRSDLHTLFDLKLIAIDCATMTLLVSPLLDRTCYAELRGQSIQAPNDPQKWPSHKALEQQRMESGL